MSRVLYLIVCAAAPVSRADRLVTLAQSRAWDVWVIATPDACGFADIATLEQIAGHSVRISYKGPGSDGIGMPYADAIVVAPASMNTLGKWANGISDTFATGILGESFGFGVPIIVLPFFSDAQARNPAYVRNTRFLQDNGVIFPVGIGRPGRVRDFPWSAALKELG